MSGLKFSVRVHFFSKHSWLSACNKLNRHCREKLNSMNLMLYMAPIAVVVLLPAALVMEPDVFDLVVALGKEHKFMWILLFVNSTMAYGANLCNFLVTKHTSALTLQVRLLWPACCVWMDSIWKRMIVHLKDKYEWCDKISFNLTILANLYLLSDQVLGNAKGAVAVVISILIFRNPVTFIGIAGYTMTVMGVVAYGESKRRQKWPIAVLFVPECT